MNAIILYGSRYGAARRYAEALAAKMGITAEPYRTKRNLSACDTVIYFGSLYAGRVTGLANTAARLSEGQSVIIVTVGLADQMTAPTQRRYAPLSAGRCRTGSMRRQSCFSCAVGLTIKPYACATGP